MPEIELACLHAIVSGHVQGVGFRAFVQDQAVRLRLAGWVRNRWDGSVEVLAEGERDAVEKLLTSLYRGPRGAYVSGLTPEWLAVSGSYSGFRVRMTAD